MDEQKFLWKWTDIFASFSKKVLLSKKRSENCKGRAFFGNLNSNEKIAPLYDLRPHKNFAFLKIHYRAAGRIECNRELAVKVDRLVK